MCCLPHACYGDWRQHQVLNCHLEYHLQDCLQSIRHRYWRDWHQSLLFHRTFRLHSLPQGEGAEVRDVRHLWKISSSDWIYEIREEADIKMPNMKCIGHTEILFLKNSYFSGELLTNTKGQHSKDNFYKKHCHKTNTFLQIIAVFVMFTFALHYIYFRF